MVKTIRTLTADGVRDGVEEDTLVTLLSTLQILLSPHRQEGDQSQ